MGNRQSSLGNLPLEYPKRQDPVLYDSKVDYSESLPIEGPPTYSEARGPTSTTREFGEAYQAAPQFGQTYQSQPQPTRQFNQWDQPQPQPPRQFNQWDQPQPQYTRQPAQMYQEHAVPFRTEQGMGYTQQAPRGYRGGRRCKNDRRRQRREWRDERREWKRESKEWRREGRHQIGGLFSERRQL